MKKNRLFMLGIVAVFVGILSLTLVSSTFAKYTTNLTSSNETASVAKWGVKITTKGDDLFSKTYSIDEDNQSSSITNSVSATTKTLAPGTTKTAVMFSISGTPEVAVRVSYDCSVKLTGWVIGNNDNEFYCPLNFKIKKGDGTVLKTVSAKTDSTKSVDDLKSELESAIKNAIKDTKYEFGPNTDLSQQSDIGFTIEWEWPFEGSGTEDAYQKDEKDTALADKTSLPKIEISVTATVEQID